jgi:hypothetical protein
MSLSGYLIKNSFPCPGAGFRVDWLRVINGSIELTPNKLTLLCGISCLLWRIEYGKTFNLSTFNIGASAIMTPLFFNWFEVF